MRASATFIFFVLVLLHCQIGQADDKRRQFFENKIRPVLVEHCYECHAAESDELGGGLRVDFAGGLIEGGDSGPAFVAGKSKESLLIDAIRYNEMEMPPDGKLPEAVIRDFEKWIEDGAYDPRKSASPRQAAPSTRVIDLEKERKFWAFQPVQLPEIPKVEDAVWPASSKGSAAIDRFLLSKMESEGLTPNRDATPETLLRRVYYDLTGLPPSPQDLESYLNAPADRRFEVVVDRLLGSKEFGVRWGRHWLDVARYADSNGGDFNATFHNAWKYRDYVIKAFNSDMPFDQFVREQIAGDLIANLDSPTNDPAVIQRRSEQIVATGFLMLGAKMLSERDKHKLTMDVVDEQVNTVGQAFLGMTLGCARCHDHKFDPILAEDYYALAGIFQSTRTLEGESQKYVSTWPRRELPTTESHRKSVAEFAKSQKALAEQIKKAKSEKEKLEQQLVKLRAGKNEIVVDNTKAKLTGVWKSSTYSPGFVGKGYIHDDKSEKGEKFVEFPVALPSKRAGESARFELQISYTPGSTRAANVPIIVKHANGETEVKIDQRKKPPIEDLYAKVGTFEFEKSKSYTVTVSTVGTVGFVIVDAIRLIELDAKGKPVQPSSIDMQLEQQLVKSVKDAAEKLNALSKKESDLKKNAPPEIPKAIAVAEAKAMVDSPVYIRGVHTNPGELVDRGVLRVVAGDQWRLNVNKQSGRLELANWLVDRSNPLTARVYVNRIWKHLFGEGLVRTVDNFGHLGEKPSHPELLDYLASEFVREGWSTKKLIRKIVLTHAYQISGRDNRESIQKDPENRWLARFPRRRLTAESIRDSILQFSGELDLSEGGSPVEGLGTLVTQNTSEEKKFESTTTARRSVYLPMIRSELPEILSVFDFADPDLVTGRRAVTNVPAQALLLLNSPFVINAAKTTASKISATESKLNEQVRLAYQTVLCRNSKSSELAIAKRFLDRVAKEEKQKKIAEPRGLWLLVHSLMASAEFRILE